MENTKTKETIWSLVLFILALFGVFGTIINSIHHHQDELRLSNVHASKLVAAYEDHLVVDYRKDICGLTPTLDAPRNKLSDKDRACEIGVREKARKEVEAIKN